MTVVWIVLGLLGALFLLFVLGWANAIRASGVRNRKLEAMVRPALEAARENRPNAVDMIKDLAETPATRNHLFACLKEMGKPELFPSAFRAIEKVAESDLARWLMHPNELGAEPFEMELVRKISVQDDAHSGSVFLFRFRTDRTHWAAKYGWMAGIAGPYWDGDDAPDFASGTFSELTPFDTMTEEQHVEYLKQMMQRRGLVVRC